ncbi:protein Red [Nephila pilipes]|uniref:Protein Red n=1 Tax=Nephila pilipes TaxID=299642 RepID=A0A8X6PR60_NEPPI|nr:protein Red [Nephila pilipes]
MISYKQYEMKEIAKKEGEDLDSLLLEHNAKEEGNQFKTKLRRNIYRQVFGNRYPEKIELSHPKRKVYIINLKHEYADSDVPINLLRSKADCLNFESQKTLTTNDIVM